MALSGSFSKYATSSFGLYCTWSGTQSITGNYTDVTVKVYISHQRLTSSARPATIAINGTSESFTAAAIRSSSSSWQKTLIKTKTVRVNHNTDGTKNSVSLSASWNFSGTYNGVSVGTITASTTVNLNKIDRTAPTVSVAISQITASSVKLSIASTATANRWWYSLNGGSSWKEFNSADGTKKETTVTGLTPNTLYKIQACARKKTNNVDGYSSITSIKTLGGSVLSSVSKLTADDTTATITLSATVYDTNYTHTLVLKNGAATVLTITGLKLSNEPKTITLTAEQRSAILSYMAEIKSFTGTFTLTTFNGTTQIGTASSKNATVETTAANSAPIFSGFSYKDTNTTAIGVTDDNSILIQNISDLQVVATAATAKNGATISGYSVSVGGTKVSSDTTTINVGKIVKSGKMSLEVTAIDSRGYSTTKPVNITVLEYEKIHIKSYSMRRINNVENYTNVSINGEITPIKIGGTNKNALLSLKYRYKKTSDKNYSAYTDISPTNCDDNSFEFTVNEWLNLDLDPKHSYNVQFFVADNLTSNLSNLLTITIPQGTPLVSYRSEKVGINNRNPSEALDVNGNIKVSGGIICPTLPKIAVGRVTITPTTANTPISITVTFPEGLFTATPSITVTPHTSAPGSVVLGVGVANSSKTGFDIYLTRTNAVATTVSWQAIQI